MRIMYLPIKSDYDGTEWKLSIEDGIVTLTDLDESNTPLLFTHEEWLQLQETIDGGLFAQQQDRMQAGEEPS